MAKKVLIVYNSLSGNTKAAAEAFAEGIKEVNGATVVLKNCYNTTADDIMNCDAVALGSYDAFSYMGGGLKDFFDRIYYSTKEKIRNKPYVAFLTHGGGGKAIDSIIALANKLGLKEAANPLLSKGKPDREKIEELRKAGSLLAKTVII
ncbi:MAG: flavodoxin domain-containing protein [bacterium]